MVVIHRRVLVIFFLVIIMSIICAAATYIFSEAADGENKARIIVDAGHGDPDGGAVGVLGTLEKDLNLAIAMKLAEVLEGKGFSVVMTRMGDKGIYDDSCKTIREMKRSDMKARLAIMKNSGADLFVSVHMNSFTNKSANGLHIFYAKNHKEAESLAAAMQVRIAEVTGASTHAVKCADERLFLMKNPSIPAILAECGFLSNEAEERKLCDSDYQARLAWAIAEAIEDYF